MNKAPLTRRSQNRKTALKPITQYNRADVKRLRLLLNADRGWSQARFARELGKRCGNPRGFSLAYEKMLEKGERNITIKIATALAALERDEAAYYSQVRDENKHTLDSMVRGIELRVDELTAELRQRLKRVVGQ